ncbi:MAG: hypothetical protein ACOCQH_01680 [Halanaerobiales bacterium]
MNDDYNLYWGDIHNHNQLGYGKGTLERAIDIAKEHLDFFAFTPHGQWFDEENTGQEVHEKHQRGFDIVRENWDYIKKKISEASQPGQFLAFLAHEWHSTHLGDYHLVYPRPEFDISYFDDIRELQKYAAETGALLIPHHIGYRPGRRGLDWNHFSEDVSPVVEIFSEHGSSEVAGGAWPMVGHSMGPATTTRTARYALESGKVFGFTASSDNHRGFPGAYGEGITAVLADSLTGKGIFSALKNRRCYAVTGDRIKISFRINNAPMGSMLTAKKRRNIQIEVESEDKIRIADLIKNGRIYRRVPLNKINQSPDIRKEKITFKLRVEWGWGGMDKEEIVDWIMNLELEEGRILAAVPHYQSGPFTETKRHRIEELTANNCKWKSYSSRQGAFKGIPTNSIVFTIKAALDSKLNLKYREPVSGSEEFKVEEILEHNIVKKMGESFTAESLLIHQALPLQLLKLNWQVLDDDSSLRDVDYYYLRVLQNNNHIAWSSPIWVKK